MNTCTNTTCFQNNYVELCNMAIQSRNIMAEWITTAVTSIPDTNSNTAYIWKV